MKEKGMESVCEHANVEPERLSVRRVAPDLFAAFADLDRIVNAAVDPQLVELIKVRASQLNGCAFCLDMHTKDARARGESEQRLHLLASWREAPVYTERERAALALTEAVTLVADTRVPRDVWELASKEFTPAELAAVLMAIVTIHGWNRIAIASRTPVGLYGLPKAVDAQREGVQA
jgi:AhpD family alkylhydroperoxidase